MPPNRGTFQIEVSVPLLDEKTMALPSGNQVGSNDSDRPSVSRIESTSASSCLSCSISFPFPPPIECVEPPVRSGLLLCRVS